MTSSVAVCFDATGTLIEMTESVGEVYHRVALDFGVELPAWRLEDAFERVLRSAPPRGADGSSQADREASEIDWWSERIRQTFQATDSTARFEDFAGFAQTLFEAYRSASQWRLRDGARPLLEDLAASGPSLGLLSNFDHRLPDILQGLEISDFFSSVLIPSMHGERKPERAAFERAARTLGCPVEGLLYVGDDSPERMAQIAAHGVQVLSVTTDRPLADCLPAIRAHAGRDAAKRGRDA